MSLWNKILNALHPDRLTKEIDEEIQTHLDEAREQGRNTTELHKAFGSPLRHREETRDTRIVATLDNLRADTIFATRRLRKSKITSAAAILSLALAIGACTSAFRLIDALLLRPLPVSDPTHLYAIAYEGVDRDGNPTTWDSSSYPMFRQWRTTLKDQAEFIAVSNADRRDITYASDQEMEKAHVQYVSGWIFQAFGLQPALGRLLTEADDRKPGAHPVAVLSHDYWTRRFGQDPTVIGRTFHMGKDIYEIVGVAEEPFIGTEPGIIPAIFVPTMMIGNAIDSTNSFWLRTFVRPKPGVPLEPLRAKLYALYRALEEQRSNGFAGYSKSALERFAKQKLLLTSAAAGVSGLQKNYRRALTALAALVALVLLIACANVANLMTAQAAARSREMALRVSIGAGRARLVQLVLVESACVASLATAFGALFAAWSAPFVVSLINPPNNPARLILKSDWRVFAFTIALTLGVTLLFGLLPALKASATKPSAALKGGTDPHARRRLMHALIALQVAFCFVVLFAAGLFVTTFDRLSNQPTGFSTDRLLVLDTVTPHAQPPIFWNQVAGHLRTQPGIESVAISAWPLMTGTMSNNHISVNGAPPQDTLAFFLNTSPGWLETMKIPLIDGRDFQPNDTDLAIVNETFAKQYFKGENPIGKSFETTYPKPKRLQIIGLVRDARYRDIREPMLPVAYVPFQATGDAAIMVRTSTPNPLALAQALRREVPKGRSEFRVSNIRTQQEINDALTIRERLLATLALFFAAVALLLAGVGLYGVLDYSVIQRRREIGIRIAIGAQPASIAKLITTETLATVLTGALAGLALGLIATKYIATLFYQVKPTDAQILALPTLAILTAALLAALPAIIHAVQIDPVTMLRSE